MSWILILRIHRDVLTQIRKHLEVWKKEAEQIPNQELRKQALLSIEKKAFHCGGGSIYALLAQGKIKQTIRFIVAYQTITAVFFCMRYKVVGFEAGGRRQEGEE